MAPKSATSRAPAPRDGKVFDAFDDIFANVVERIAQLDKTMTALQSNDELHGELLQVLTPLDSIRTRLNQVARGPTGRTRIINAAGDLEAKLNDIKSKMDEVKKEKESGVSMDTLVTELQELVNDLSDLID